MISLETVLPVLASHINFNYFIILLYNLILPDVIWLSMGRYSMF